MNAILLMPSEKVNGNVLWIPPYVYPQEYLNEGVEMLREKGYWLNLFQEDDGITFDAKHKAKDEILDDFIIAFPWMQFHTDGHNDHLAREQLIILPVQRLLITKPVISQDLCLFPPGMMNIHKMKLLNMSGEAFGMESSNLRDYITTLTEVNASVFDGQPLIVMRDNLSHSDFLSLNHYDDVELIRKYSRKADDLLDLLRLYEGDYYLPETLPSKAGIWSDRYSTMLIYFPKYATGYIQSREVEAKNFIRGIGMEFTRFSAVELHPLLQFIHSIGETGQIARHAMRLHSAVQELDDYSMKFMQAIILFEMIGDPDQYLKFKDIKKRLIAVLAENRVEANRLSLRFKELTDGVVDHTGLKQMGLRTAIVHTGKRIDDLLKPQQIKDLMYELQNYAYLLIQDMIFHYQMSWEHYNLTRERRLQVMS